MAIEVEWRDYDVIVVGSGGAGSHAARSAAESGASVLVVSKDPIGCSDTKISEGIATVRESGATDDSADVLSENLQMAGGNLPDKNITDAFAEDSKLAYDRYRQNGLRPSIDKEKNTPQTLPLPMGGHNKRRSVGHKNAGIAFGHANWDAVVQGKNIDYLEDAWFLDLVTEGKGPEDQNSQSRIVGGLIYDATRGVLVAVRTPAVVIAAGGLSTLFFPKTDTMRGNTGDSYAVAYRAGAELVDMEQLQFLPFCLASPPSYEGLVCGEPVVASFLGVLRDKNQKVILDSVYLRTRAECASAIMRAVADGRGTPNGGAYLDMTANKRLPKSGPHFMRFVETSLPSAYRNARQALGKDAAKCDEAWEVRPAAHYHMGGVRVNADGASVAGEGDGQVNKGIRGLFAAGQAMGGLFGANRLGSTSLTEGVVFGSRAGQAAAALALENKIKVADGVFDQSIDEFRKRFGQKGGASVVRLRMDLQNKSWDCIGPIRTAEGLTKIDALIDETINQLDEINIPADPLWNQTFIDFIELRNMIDTARLVSAAAQERDGSLGGHIRLDRSTISLFAQPYSTIVNENSGNLVVSRKVRPRTPIKRLLQYKISEGFRIFRAKCLRLMPTSVLDNRLEQKYKSIMGHSGVAPEIMPGGAEGAVGEA